MWFFLPVIQRMLRKKRRCPSCGKAQLVCAEDERKTVRCKHCGADMPPPKKRS